MQKIFLFIFLIFSIVLNAQTEESYTDIDDLFANENISIDTLTYNKTLEYYKQREFDDDLKTKYSGKEFEYIDDLKEEKPREKEEKKSSPINANLFIGFMTSVFPYLLGILVVFIILKSFVNIESGFWKFGNSSKMDTKKLIHENTEDIESNNYEKLLGIALKDKNYRLATRYYYLFLLKILSQKELITYHKDKTNTEYKFELENKQTRNKFSYLAYIYDYVWYGEFPIDESEFKTIEYNYKTFIHNI